MAYVQDIAVLAVMLVNSALLIALIFVYLRNYMSVKSSITLGMLLFSVALFLENIMNLYFYKSIMTAGILEITSFQLLVSVFEMAAIIVLLYVTLK